jgi:hypothetical protein
MAELLKKILGSASGKVGDLVFKRYKNGKVFFSTHKGYNTISDSPNCVKNRANFNNAVKFSKAVNSLPELRQIWNYSNIEGRSAYTKILRFNIKLLKDTIPSLSNRISPKGFGFMASNLILSNNSIIIDIKLGDSSEDLLDLPFTANFVVALFNQKQNISEEVYPFAVATAEFIPENTSEFENIIAYFDSTQKQFVESYTKAIVYMSFTKTDVKPFVYSGSFAMKTDIVQ